MFRLLKEHLISAHVVVTPDWSVSFELMCDASDTVVGTILGQRRKVFHTLHHDSRTLDEALKNYTTIEKSFCSVNRMPRLGS